MSHNSGGFFSLNRLFGKKIKHEKPSSMDHSKSTTQTLLRSNTNPEGISPQNKIAPLTTIPNAPFEQTFRITIYLPLGQLYVARIGAKTKLSELLNTICTNKSLDPTKFEFRHPTDDTQIFDLSFTVGEVGLSEIKLVPKNIKDDTAVRYRIHSNLGRENRFGAQRPHTMSSVSPYSSTNSLNSTDSSGIMMNQRVNNGVPVAPNRKKRVAPRPPSQNSIPENPEKTSSKDESNSQSSRTGADSNIDTKHSNLLRQNFHVSSPNLATSNNMSFKSNGIGMDSSATNSFDRRQSENYINNNKKLSLNRPLSIQLSKTANADYSHEFKSQISENLNLRKNHCHSRTPSDASATNDTILPEPQPRTRPPISLNKKKAPAPPPRTVSTNLSGYPIATPRNCIAEDASDETINDKIHELQLSPDLGNQSISVKKSTNVSKVMLNVIEKSSNNDEGPNKLTNNNNTNHKEISCHVESTTSNQRDQESIDSNEITNESVINCKSVSVVNLNSSTKEEIDKSNNTDHTAVALQVKEIIDAAVRINEAKQSISINQNSDENSQTGICSEINNNDEADEKGHHEEKQNGEENADEDKCRPENSRIDTVEVPIQPVLNETRTFSFHEYNDSSLPASTTSTLNTTETPSTGPESLITSDIEDGYKGNELEKTRKSEFAKCDSKEDFIESQFEFLKEHLDNRANIDSDEEKTMEFSKRDIISSTMINENYKIVDKKQPVDKNDLINELTQMISCNRLETFIKPNAQTNDVVLASKRSSLKNFQISAYSNGNLEITKAKPIGMSEFSGQQSLNSIEYGDNSDSQSIFDSSVPSHAVEDQTNRNVKTDETFVIGKQINRSVSFHTTLASAIDDGTSTADIDPGFGSYSTQRCSSYLSLNGPQKYEQSTVQSQENSSTGSVRQKSSSELSIADTPSLQSIKVMKSILNSSVKMNPDSKNIQEEKKSSATNENQVNMDDQIRSSALKKETSTTNQKKSWSYQGPPSINFSTWGDRPKTAVNIKSDEDYIFGGTSKMAALQKRFSGTEPEKRKDVHSPAELPFKKPNVQTLPVVRSVEYKKKIHNDSPDSSPQITPFRPNYEVSHIVSNNSLTKKENTFSKDDIETNVFKAVPVKVTNPTQRVHSNSNFTSFNIPKETQSKNQINGTKEENTEAPEMPMFTQFKLRKTGLKDKMFDKDDGTQVENSVKQIPAPPKPPTLAKPKIRPVSMNNKLDTRDQLLDCIRNFNRDTLKKNVIY